MRQLQSQDVDVLSELVAKNTPLPEAIAGSIGDTHASEGLWRFYSANWPFGGVRTWNEVSQWKTMWRPFLPAGAFAFGEDVFGNQLMIVDGLETVQLLDHETAEFSDLYCEPDVLLRTVLQDGIDWIDQYGDGSLSIARLFLPVSLSTHLHWVTPLMLGGDVSRENISIVDRESHLVGHAKLWSQLRDLPPGSAVDLRRQ